MLIETDPGAANQVAGEIPYALRPDAPSVFRVVGPPDPRGLRSGVASDLDALFLLLATLSLIVGAFGIANTTLVSVLERTGEIGLRRALGGRPIHVAAQFLAESGALGLIGGITGSAIGVLIVVVTAYAKSWTAILPGWAVVVAPAAGLFVGLLAGCYPALRAARIEPLEALRR